MIGLFKKPVHERALGRNPFNIIGDDSPSGLAGVAVNQDSAMRLSAVWACVRRLTMDISSLPVDALVRGARGPEPLSPQPAWIKNPNPFDPSQTGVDHIAQVVMSMLLDGNAFTLALPTVLNPTDLHVLNPRLVEVDRDGRGEPTYRVRDSRGKLAGEFTALNIIHVPLWRKPGEARGLSPIEAMAQGIGRGLAAEELGARYFGQGSTFGAVLEYPKEVDPDPNDVKDVLSALNKRHRGVRNSWALGAVTGGGQLKELGMKPADAQLIETEEWTLEQVARAFGMHPSMVGSQRPGSTAYNSAEQRSTDYAKSAVAPLTVRIEAAYGRTLSRGYLEIRINGLMRGDMAARSAFYREGINAGWMTRAEARDWEDLGILDGLGVPLAQQGMAPAEAINDTGMKIKVDMATKLVQYGYEPSAALILAGLPPVAHTGLPPVTVQPEDQGDSGDATQK